MKQIKELITNIDMCKIYFQVPKKGESGCVGYKYYWCNERECYVRKNLLANIYSDDYTGFDSYLDWVADMTRELEDGWELFEFDAEEDYLEYLNKLRMLLELTE